MLPPHTPLERDFPLGIPGFSWADLHDPVRLRALLEVFDGELAEADRELMDRLAAGRANPDTLPPEELSALLVALGPQVSVFVARLFGIENHRAAQRAISAREGSIFSVKKEFSGRKGKKFAAEAAHFDFAALHGELLAKAGQHPVAKLVPEADAELRLAIFLQGLLDAEPLLDPKNEVNESQGRAAGWLIAGGAPGGRGEFLAWLAWVIDMGAHWAAAAAASEAGRAATQHWAMFRQPRPMHFDALVQITKPRADMPELMEGPRDTLRKRDGFHLTDARPGARETLGEAHYCILCAGRDKDSCSKGFYKINPEKSGAREYLKNPLGIELTGCPLDEKISEMHEMRRDGDAIAAVAIVCVDNPMLPGTGHRICNDCMKSCIFQKQEPVNIPAAETGVLTDLLELPYGFEIWSLLTRWNPLNLRRPCALPFNGKKILVVGMGPAGYTLAHYLLNDGFAVVGIDGLKIEPPDAALSGADGRAPRPVVNAEDLQQDLATRKTSGFGGVSEYGITVRWDKNFLTLLHLNLARRKKMTIVGGVRFGGTLTIEQAWELGFDHIAIAAGAGRPTIINLKNNLIRGIRKASDFLMGLQLTGAYRHESLANLQLRLPALVVGGGLTAIDTATEALAYYPVQCEKLLSWHEALALEKGEAAARLRFDAEEIQILDTLLDHARALRGERARAQAAGEAPDFLPLLNEWGGVTLAYRKRLQDSPAYRLNYEEVVKAFEEGIRFAENLEPLEAHPDAHGALEAVTFKRGDGGEIRLPGRALLVAAGTSPNTTYEKEYPGSFLRDEKGQFFKPHRAVVESSGWTQLEPSGKGDGFFTSYHRGGKFISFFGDNHPHYAGNVVKAMASAKDGHPFITAIFAPQVAKLDGNEQSQREVEYEGWAKTLDDLLVPRVTAVNRLTETIIEVVVRAPLAARNFQPGQFYRLQNYEQQAPQIGGAILTTEPLALTGAWVDPVDGLLSMIALELGVSSRLCAALKPGEPIVVMGPTGTPTVIPEAETVLLVGGGLGNAVLFSIARACKQRGNRVLYVAGYKKATDLFKRDEIEAATDLVIYAVDPGNGTITPRRAADRFFQGNIVQAMRAYGAGELGEPPIPMSAVTRLIVIGSDRMMAAVKAARHTVLAPFLRPGHAAIGSINSPMQCMMKEVCAQCLQKHIDPVTGKESFVFSCYDQDQPLDQVDFVHLNARLRQNTVNEKLSSQYFELLTEKSGLVRV